VGRCEGGGAYHDIEPTELFNGEIDSTLYLSLDPDVGLGRDGLDVRIPRCDQGRHRFGSFEVNVDQEDVRTLRSKQQGGFQSNTTVLKKITK
jgi:hypothetical protein